MTETEMVRETERKRGTKKKRDTQREGSDGDTERDRERKNTIEPPKQRNGKKMKV